MSTNVKINSLELTAPTTLWIEDISKQAVPKKALNIMVDIYIYY